MACCNDCDSIQLPIPDDGVGISSITLNGSNQFVITLTDASIITTSAVTITATSANILYNNTTSETTNVAAGATQIGTKTYTIPANTLVTDGDEIRVTAWVKLSTTTLDSFFRGWIYINGAWFSTSYTSGGEMIWIGGGAVYMKMELILKRKTNTTAYADFQSWTYDDKQNLNTFLNRGRYDDLTPGLPAFNFTTNSIIVAVYGQSLDGDGNTVIDNTDMVCDKLTIEYIKKT